MELLAQDLCTEQQSELCSMKTKRITIKRLKPSPLQVAELRGVTRYVYRLRVDGKITRSGITRSLKDIE